jgi:putative addiction module component
MGHMALKSSSLRKSIYRILDQILETGDPRIAPEEPKSKLDNLKARPYLLSDPEELVHLDWSGEWHAEAERRVNQIESGEVKLIPGEEVFSRLRQKYGR